MLTTVSAGSLAEKLSQAHLKSGSTPSTDNVESSRSSTKTASHNGSPSLNGTNGANGSSGASNGSSTTTTAAAGGPDLSDLPKLKTSALPKLPKSKGPRWVDAVAAPAAAEVPAQRSSCILEISGPKDREAVSRAVAEAQKTGVTIEASKNSTGVVTFLLRGAPEKVDTAKRELRRRLSPKLVKHVHIPNNARSTVLGQRGQTLRKITETTHTSINVGNVLAPRHGWSLPLVDVEIQGPGDGVADALQQIQDVVGAKGPVQDTRVVPERLALLAGRFARHNAPQTVDTSLKGYLLRLAGPLDDVLQLAALVDQFVADSEQGFSSRLHSHNAVPVDLVLEEHGVVVLDGEVYGPSDRLELALAAVNKHISSLKTASVDVAKAHGRDEQHAARVIQLLEAWNVAKTLQQQHGLCITRNGTVFHFAGAQEDAVVAGKKALISSVTKLSPAAIYAVDGITTSVGLAQAKQIAKTVQTRKIITPVVGDSAVLLVYQGDDSEDFAPSAEEMRQELAAVAKAFEKVAQNEADQVSKVFELPKQDHKFLREPLGAIKLQLSALTETNGFQTVHFDYSDKNSVVVKGASADVAKVLAALPQILAQSRSLHERSNYSESLQFDQTLVKKLIGRNGASVSQIRQDFDIKIDVDESALITLRGLEENVKKAKAHILDFEKQLKDFRAEEISIPSQYHAMLIGAKGRFANRLREKYHVNIKFPQADDSDTDGSAAGSAGSTGSSGGDIIVVSGPSKGVAATKREFQDLIEYEKQHSFQQDVFVPEKLLARVIGRQGVFIKQVRDDTDVSIDIDRTANDDGNATVHITGLQKAVATAAKRFEAAVAALEDIVDRKIEIDPQWHRYLMGPGGDTRRQIVADAGGEVEPLNPRTLVLPSAGSSSSTVKLFGPSKVVDALERIIRAKVAELENKQRFTETLSIPSDQVRVIIGPGGSTKRGLEQEHGVAIDVPRSSGGAKASDTVTVKAATEEAIEATKKAIYELIDVGRAKVSVPATVEADLFNRGALANLLSSKFAVRLVTAKRPSAPRAVDASGVAKPEFADGKPYAFTTTAYVAPEATRSSTWTLLGKDEASCAKAAEHVENAIKQHQQHNTTGFLWLAKPSMFTNIIGPGGSAINEIRTRTGCQIVIPQRGGDDSAPATIRGTVEQVEAAQKELLERISS